MFVGSGWVGAVSSFFRSVSDSDSSSSDEDEELSSGSESDTGLQGLKKAKNTKGSGDDSDDDDDSDDNDSDDDDDKAAPKKAFGSRFLKGAASDDSDSDDEKTKVVKSAKSKRAEEVEASAKAIDNAGKINDWAAIQAEFDKLTKFIARQANVGESIPPTFIKTLVSIEDLLAAAQASKKKMNTLNTKALNAMKQKLRKAKAEHDDAFTRYKADPDAFLRAADEEAKPKDTHKKAKKAGPSAAADDEEDDGFETVGNKGKAVAISSEGVYKALAQVLEARGRKNTDRAEQTKILDKLLAVTATPYQKIRVLLALISARLDYNASTLTHMPVDAWVAARGHLDILLDTLISEREYAVRDDAPDYDDQVERSPSATEPIIVVRGSVISLVDRLDDEFTKSLQNIDPHTGEYIDRLKDEKSIYQSIVKAQIYYEQIKVASDIDRVVMRRLEHIYCKPDAVTLALETSLPELAAQSTIYPSSSASSSSANFSALALVRALCIHLYKTDQSLLRTRAMLSHIYHYAQHDDYYTARDMLLMSHLQDTVGGADVGTQILYNRVSLKSSSSRLVCSELTTTPLLACLLDNRRSFRSDCARSASA